MGTARIFLWTPVTLSTSWLSPPPGPNCAAVTVDDGYADFLQAWPVFKSYGIPVTVYLVSGFLDRELWLWMDEVQVLAGDRGRELCEQFKNLRNGDRLRALEELRRTSPRPAAMPDRSLPMTWDDARSLAKEGVRFGAHTRSHPILTRLDDPRALDAEIAGSKARIEEQLDCPVVDFCYPNGTAADFDGRVIQSVRDAGFHSAVTTEPGLNAASTDRFLLRRIGADPWVSRDYFAELLAGVRGHRPS